MTGMEMVAAFAADAILGDPRSWPHPVRLIGRVVEWGEGMIRRVSRSPRGLQVGGVLLALSLPGLVFASTWGLIEAATQLSWWLGLVASIYLGYTTLAARDLRDHAMSVWSALEQKDLPGARSALSLIVGRDTDQLDEPEVIRATIESVAENASDGIVAPLLYLAIGGPPLAMAYKAVNTLDSMVGYRNARYQWLGWGAARLDDLMNLVPARVTGVLVAASAPLLGLGGRSAWRMMRRDGHRHPSPNSGIPEAAVAGALGVRLGGGNYYHGVRSERPLIGDPICSLDRRQIPVAMKLVWVASLLLVVLIVVGKAI